MLMTVSEVKNTCASLNTTVYSHLHIHRKLQKPH